jgi:hypothetical protein
MGLDGTAVGDALAVAVGLGMAVEDDGDGVGFAGFMVLPGIGAMLTCGDGLVVIPGIGAIVMPGIGAIVGVACAALPRCGKACTAATIDATSKAIRNRWVFVRIYYGL